LTAARRAGLGGGEQIVHLLDPERQAIPGELRLDDHRAPTGPSEQLIHATPPLRGSRSQQSEWDVKAGSVIDAAAGEVHGSSIRSEASALVWPESEVSPASSRRVFG
jgi:hypothetical protein